MNKKVKLTKYVSVDLPMTPNFIIHQDGKTKVTVPIHMFTTSELKKVGKAWTDELIKRAQRTHAQKAKD